MANIISTNAEFSKTDDRVIVKVISFAGFDALAMKAYHKTHQYRPVKTVPV